MAISLGATVSNSGNQANSSGFSFNHTTNTNTKALVVVVTAYDATAGDRAISSVTFNSVALTKGHEYSTGSACISVWYKLNPQIGGAFSVTVTPGGACTDIQASAVNLVTTAEILKVSQDDGTGTGSASATLGSVATGTWMVGGGIAVGGTPASLSVSAGTEVSGSEVDMGSQTASVAYGTESGGTVTLTWSYSAVTVYAAGVTFRENNLPTVSLGSPADAATGVSVTPALTFTGTDADSEELEYEVAVAYGKETYKKTITITGATGAGTNYQVLLKIGETSGATGEDFDLGGNSADFPNAKNDSGDLRFTAADGVTNLSFWVEQVTGTTPNRLAYVWVKVTADLGSNQDIVCFYGNSAASNLSSGTNTFLLFDDFDDSTIDTGLWSTTTGSSASISESGDTLSQLDAAVSGSNTTLTSLSTSYGVGHAVRTRYRRRDTGTYANCQQYLAGGTIQLAWANFENKVAGTCNLGETIISATDLTQNAWYRAELQGAPDGTTCNIRVRNDDFTTFGTDDTNTGASFSNNYVGLRSADGADMETDFIIVRKYVATEPAFSSAGSEASAFLLDKTSSTGDATFSGTGDPHPWPSGNEITYQVQAGDTLTALTVYYWKVRANDSYGWGSWTAWRSFTTASSSAIKTVQGLAKASVKTVQGLAIASVKTIQGLT